ncbi:MAG: NTP transferase domain-containing protein [Ilumatobacter sp.]
MSDHAATGKVGVLLAAGGGSRFDGDRHKLLGLLPASETRPAETVMSRSLAAASEASFDVLLVVTGRMTGRDLELDRAHLDDAVIEVVHNDRWADGQATSVAAGLLAAERLGARQVAIGLGDQPGIESSAWQAVGEALTDEHPIAVATYAGRRANPVAMARSIWHLIPRTGDRGARALMSLRPDLVVEVPCSGSPDDIDTEEDLRRWQSS